MHSHTCHDAWGDGNQTVETLLRYVEENTDLDLFAITDHDSTDAARAAWRLHRKGGYRFGFIPGVEVTNQSGHLLCYFPEGNIVEVPSLRPFWSTVRYRSRARRNLYRRSSGLPSVAGAVDRTDLETRW